MLSSHNGYNYYLYDTDGVFILNDEFVDESNFHISQVKMKVKIPGAEAGWIVTVSEFYN